MFVIVLVGIDIFVCDYGLGMLICLFGLVCGLVNLFVICLMILFVILLISCCKLLFLLFFFFVRIGCFVLIFLIILLMKDWFMVGCFEEILFVKILLCFFKLLCCVF